MKTVKKPTKAHKNKKVVKAHQGMAHVPKKTSSIIPPTQQPTKTRSLPEPSKIQAPIKQRPTPTISDGGGGRGATTTRKVAPSTSGFFPSLEDYRIRRRKPTRAEQREMDTQKEINKRMRDNKVVQRSRADLKGRRDAAIKKRGGMNNVMQEVLDYYRGGRKGKRPERIDPFKGMSSRERRRAQNATRSELDETNRPVRKQMGTQRKPRQPRVGLGGIQTPLLGTPISYPQQAMPRPEVSYPQYLDPRILQKRNKGGVVKKKYAEIKTLKQGGYISRAKYGSVDNLKKKK